MGLILDEHRHFSRTSRRNGSATRAANPERYRRPGCRVVGDWSHGNRTRALPATTPAIRLAREAFLNDLLADLTVYPYTKETALLAARVDAEQRSKGVVIPFGDLLIGATALLLGFSVLTMNTRHFRLIPGLTVTQL